MRCERFEKLTFDGREEALAELREHATGCEDCRSELDVWEALSAASADLHEEWESPDLEGRILEAVAKDRDRSTRLHDLRPAFWLHQ